MDKVHVYNGNSDNTQKIFDLYADGYKILCPRCRSEIIVVLDEGAVQRHKKTEGLYCSKNLNHLYIRLISGTKRRALWETYNQKLKEKKLR